MPRVRVGYVRPPCQAAAPERWAPFLVGSDLFVSTGRILQGGSALGPCVRAWRVQLFRLARKAIEPSFEQRASEWVRVASITAVGEPNMAGHGDRDRIVAWNAYSLHQVVADKGDGLRHHRHWLE